MRFIEHTLVPMIGRIMPFCLGVLLMVYVDAHIFTIYHGFSQGLHKLAKWSDVDPSVQAILRKNAVWSRELSFIKPSEWIREEWFWRSAHKDYPDLVVAHYREDLGWLGEIQDYVGHVYLYCKDADQCTKGLPLSLESKKITVVHLPNVGREAHTFLYHILTHYDHLAHRTVFTMSSFQGNYLRQFSLKAALGETKKRFFPLFPEVFARMRDFQMEPFSQSVSLGDGYDYLQAPRLMPTQPRPLGLWAQAHMGLDIMARHGRYGSSRHGAIFSVSKEAILSHTLQEYEHLFFLNTLSSTTEAGYFMEQTLRFYIE
jgi:hypothetical protein